VKRTAWNVLCHTNKLASTPGLLVVFCRVQFLAEHLKGGGEDVKTVQEVMRHASSRLTLDVYAQALTPAKRAAHLKLVGLIQRQKQQMVVYGPTLKMQSL